MKTAKKLAAGKSLISLPGAMTSGDAKALIHSITREYLTLRDTEQLKFDIEMLYIEKENQYIDETIEHQKDFERTLRSE